MKSRIVFISFLALTVFVLSDCSNKDQSTVLEEVPFKEGKITKVFIERINPEIKEVKLSKFILDFQVIPLETKEECLIANNWITFCETSILVGTQHSTAPARLFRFDHQGNFINEIGKPGNGPGEHTGYWINDIHCDNTNQTILVNWYGGNSDPQIFNFKGSFLNEIDQPYRSLDIHKWSDSVWFSTGTLAGKPGNTKDSIALVFYDKDGRVIRKIPRKTYPPKNTKKYTPGSLGSSPSLYQYKDQWRLYMSGNDTVFRIRDLKLYPLAVLVPGKNILPFNGTLSPNQLSGKYSLGILTETNGNWFLKKNVISEADLKRRQTGRWRVSIETEDRIIVIDKQNSKGARIELIDDIFHIFPSNLLSMGLQWTDKRMFFAIPPIKLKELIEKGNLDKVKNQKTKEIIDEIKQMPNDANPVIFSFTLKDKFGI